MRWVLALVFASLVGCGKKGGDEAPKPVDDKVQAESGSGKDDKVAAKDKKKKHKRKHDAKLLSNDDPWSIAARGGQAAPKDDKTVTLAQDAGAQFGKAEPVDVTTFVDKLDVATIEKPKADKVDTFSIKTLTGETTGFKVVYNPSRNAAHETYRKVFEENHIFETVATGLNKTIRLPRSVDINTVDCGQINAFYDPNGKRIIVCYELLDYFIGVFKPEAKTESELGNAVLGAMIFSFYHETGHGLIDLLKLPSTGREEDAADQIATLILMSMGDDGVGMALSGAYWFQLQSKGGHTTPFWDEHAFDGQRFYNIMCLIYGSNPDKYGGFVSSGNLPADRAKRCPEEYGKLKGAWETLLKPHLTNGAALNIDVAPSVPKAEAPRPAPTAPKDPWGDSDSDTPAEPEAPEAPAPPARPEPKTSGITCQAVAEKAAELIGAEAVERAKSMSPEEIDELQAKLEAQLPAAMEQLLKECASANWSQAQRSCILRAKSLAEGMKCQ